MPRVELIYDADCPNVAEARRALLEGFAQAGLPPVWTEWDRRAPESPPHVRPYGSPTILVDGRDVGGWNPTATSESCRVYCEETSGLRRAPSASRIAAHLLKAPAGSTAGSDRLRGRWRGLALFSTLGASGAALLPVGFCPACWPAYAGVLGAVGLGFTLNSAFVLPVTAGFFGLALFTLAWRARARRGYGPLGLGIVSAAGVLIFKFAYPINAWLYASLAGFVAAAIWNAWPRALQAAERCPNCRPDELSEPAETPLERR